MVEIDHDNNSDEDEKQVPHVITKGDIPGYKKSKGIRLVDPFGEHRQATATATSTSTITEAVAEEDVISSGSYRSYESESEEETMAPSTQACCSTRVRT